MVETVQSFAATGKPILGICLGAQLLFSRGQEFGIHEGLGIIAGEVRLFPPLKGREKIPQVGWNQIVPAAGTQWNDTVLDGVPKEASVYFVHSYIFDPSVLEVALARTIYGGHEFCSVVKQGNIYGIQFHPEKSATWGLKIIQNFVRVVARVNHSLNH